MCITVLRVYCVGVTLSGIGSILTKRQMEEFFLGTFRYSL